MSSIDAIQDRIESLTESLFEAVRNYGEQNPGTKEKMSASIKTEYKTAIHEIDNLCGADRSLAEQESELNELSAIHSQLKSNILNLQEKLLTLNVASSSELSSILNDDLCKCERN